MPDGTQGFNMEESCWCMNRAYILPQCKPPGQSENSAGCRVENLRADPVGLFGRSFLVWDCETFHKSLTFASIRYILLASASERG